jgi:hypothetical protein
VALVRHETGFSLWAETVHLEMPFISEKIEGSFSLRQKAPEDFLMKPERSMEFLCAKSPKRALVLPQL